MEGYPYAYLNPFRYSGEYFDEETGFYYLRARYYDPSIGRFLTEDPAGDGTNSDLRQGREETTQNRTGDESFAEFCLPRLDMTNPPSSQTGVISGGTTQNRTGDESFAEFCLPRLGMKRPRLKRRGFSFWRRHPESNWG